MFSKSFFKALNCCCGEADAKDAGGSFGSTSSEVGLLRPEQATSSTALLAPPSQSTATPPAASTPSSANEPTTPDKASRSQASAAGQETSKDPVSEQILHQKLWNEAYDGLEDKLVKAYEKCLEKFLEDENAPDTSATGAIDISAKLKDKDPTQRQIYMKKLVEEGKAKIATSSKVSKVVGAGAQAILAAKPVVDLLLKNIPPAAPAALPWAGVCVGLQILLNPAKASKSNRAGIKHVAATMDWYCALTGHLLNRDNANKSLESVLRRLEQGVVALYKAILFYQMRSVCSYYENQSGVFFRTLLMLDGWDDNMKSVVKAEDAFLAHWKQYDDVMTQYSRATGQKLSRELIELTETMERRLSNISQTLTEFMTQQKEMQMHHENKKCLTELRVIDPQDDIRRIESVKEELCDDANKWIFENEKYAAFTSWDESNLPQCRLLWIKGPAGTGKTMLLIGIIRELSDQLAKRAPTLSYFFCQSTNKGIPLNNARDTIRSLIWMLVIQQQHLIPHLVKKYEFSGEKAFTDLNALQAMSTLFEKMLVDAGPVYFFIDALDECEQGLDSLINLISTSLTPENKVRWLVSSRPEVDILTKLKKLKKKHPAIIETLDELDIRSQKDRVEKYIKYKLAGLKDSDINNTYNDEILATVAKEVCKRAQNNFLWMHLVFKDLNDMTGPDAIQSIENYPAGLSELYDHKMTRIERANTKYQQHCWDFLIAISLAYRLPLSLSELAIFVPLQRKTDLPKIVKECGSFLTTKEKTVNVIHKSAKDYLENERSKLRGGTIRGHADIVRLSIDAMKLSLKGNIYEREHWGIESKDITPPETDPLAPIQYCCVFWLDHLRDAIEDKEMSPEHKNELCNLGFDFMKEHFLHWLESLSLLHKLSDGIISVRKLLNVVQSPSKTSSEFTRFLKEAEKFAVSYGSIIERAPLQTYGAALAFCPTESKIKEQFWEEQRPPFLRNIKGIIHDWDSRKQTLEGHNEPVKSVAFSPDGKMLASASSDKTVRLWDLVTGTHKQTLTGHTGPVYSVAFSPDGKILASASGDRTVRLWDPATGDYKQTLEGHTGRVKSVAFSRDGTMLASASEDGRIQLWDPTMGDRKQTLADGWIHSVAFSRDGKMLASALSDGEVQLWDPATGDHKRTLESPTLHSVYSVAFSPDGKMLASASQDGTVRLWGPAVGDHKRTLEGHAGWVYSVAFSRDGKMLASASADGTVQLWNPATGDHKQTLEGHTGTALSTRRPKSLAWQAGLAGRDPWPAWSACVAYT